MNRPFKNLLRVAGVVAGLGAAAWALRDRILPAPEIHDEPPPRFRTVGNDDGTATTEATPNSTEDDLTALRGLGPARAQRLADIGITTFAQLARSDTDTLRSATGSSEAVVRGWIEDAAGRS